MTSQPTEVRIPKPGDAITEAEVTEFYVADGESATEGDPLYSIATDKVEMDIEAPASGTVSWKAEVGNTYDVGELIAVIS
ncbi:Dihydrolipoyllysine-residue acetyltransferase component of pyruvate dehydrogenase complex [Mycolicibacterium vanbaalenii]|uniref:Dihydrolipoyllysine-residue acetyltransferase component of pyruvate dehydrogenase complex n=1 Tax=Mycolicibacterium vanbaalenii TaxID=110539 RepID=A0A5S9MTF4_MYCVN|nr:lipoyl domain-containing protein [Mycolicibacterium vanbaalenii]CAA0079267.1 Dihydrolipoyllysine-residue acetyltransferase component of pyruvate dehydrogenase complex [Mycolicibacterium vanbaalenii]